MTPKLAGIGAVAICALAVCAGVAIVFAPNNSDRLALSGVIASVLVPTLVAFLTLLNSHATAAKVDEVQMAVNGHLAVHAEQAGAAQQQLEFYRQLQVQLGAASDLQSHLQQHAALAAWLEHVQATTPEQHQPTPPPPEAKA